MKKKQVKSIAIAAIMAIFSLVTIVIKTHFELDILSKILLETLAIFLASSASVAISLTINKIKNDNKGIQQDNKANTSFMFNLNNTGEFKFGLEIDPKTIKGLMELYVIKLKEQQEENLNQILLEIKEISDKVDGFIQMPMREFFIKYIDEAKNIGTTEIQRLWAKLFVYETKNPKSISHRTLDIVKNLSVEEAMLFEEMCKYTIIMDRFAIIPKEIIGEVDYELLTKMTDLLLLKSEIELIIKPEIPPNFKLSYSNKNNILIIENDSNDIVKMRIECRVLTDSGLQLINALNIDINDESFRRFAKSIKEKNKNLKVTLHKKNTVDGQVIINVIDDLTYFL